MTRIRYAMSDEAILQELGQRVAKTRINANLTQDELAEAIGVARGRISRLESAGAGKLSTLVAVLRHLDQLELLNNWLPEGTTVSPLKQLEYELKKPAERKRVRKTRAAKRTSDSSESEGGLGW